MQGLLYLTDQDYLLSSSIFFFKSAKPPISPRVVFSASEAFLAATFTFLHSCALNMAV